MDFSWTAEQDALAAKMRELGRLARQAVDPLQVLAYGGALGLAINSDHGGGGHDLVSTAYAYEALGSTLDDAGVLLAAGAHLFGVALTIQKVGSPEQCDRFLPSLATGAWIATVAATERAAGSDVSAVETTFTPSGEGYTVTGDKCYVTCADRASAFLTVGRTPGARGLTVAIVQPGQGVEVGDPLLTAGMRSARLAPLVLRDAPVDGSAVLGRAGGGMAVFQIAMTYERALVLAFRVGAMQRQLEECVSFVRQRRVGGVALTQHQAVSHRIARMKWRLESARLAVYKAAWLLDRGERAQADAAMAKWQLAEAAVENALDAFRLRGGSAFVEAPGATSSPEGLLDALGGTIHSGTQDVLANIVSRWLL